MSRRVNDNGYENGKEAFIVHMRERFERFSRNNVLLSVLMVILGLLLILWPGKTLEWAAKILGIALLLGGGLFGFLGALLCVPIMAVIHTITREWVNKRLEEKRAAGQDI